MKKKAVVPLVLGLGLGLVAVKFSMDAVKRAKGATSTDLVPVVVAMKDIASTVEIKPEMLRATKIGKSSFIPPDAFKSAQDLVGRVALKSIPQGSPIFPSMIAPQGTAPGISCRVAKGYRAKAVKIDESSGVGYLVRPGDWVDVLVVMDVSKKGKKEMVSRVILQNVEVGAVGQVIHEQQGEASKNVKSVTLVVKEDDMPTLHLAETRGKITLALRGLEDTEIYKPAEALETKVFGEPESEPGAGPSGGGSLLSRIFGAWQQAGPAPAAAAQPAAAPATGIPVTVVNASNQSGGSERVEIRTYVDAKSMSVMRVEKEGAGRSRLGTAGIGAGQPIGTGIGTTAQPVPTSPAAEPDNETPEPNEVNE